MNIALYYFGASGGFYALWHLLLGTDYKCKFSIDLKAIQEQYAYFRGADWPVHISDATTDTVDAEFWEEIERFQNLHNSNSSIQDIYEHHWDITEKPKWKATEIWPDNDTTKQANIDKKVFYYCGITETTWQQHKDDYRIILYTDLDLQILLAKNKCAWIFRKGKPTQEKIKQIQDTSTWLNGTQVYGEIAQFTQADLYVKLQDIVATRGGAILEPLGYTVTQQNREHNAMWLSLHNNEERRRLVWKQS